MVPYQVGDFGEMTYLGASHLVDLPDALSNGDYKNLGFQPHVTIAFRDLRKARFYEAWETFKNQKYERRFSVSGITLLKHQSDRWHETGTFPFMGTN